MNRRARFDDFAFAFDLAPVREFGNQRDVFEYAPLGAREPVFSQSGTTPDEIDTLHCYDGFTSQVLWTLERFGFAAGVAEENSERCRCGFWQERWLCGHIDCGR